MNILASCRLLKTVDFVLLTIKMLDKVSSLNANELRLSSAGFADRSMALRFHGNTIMNLKETWVWEKSQCCNHKYLSESQTQSKRTSINESWNQRCNRTVGTEWYAVSFVISAFVLYGCTLAKVLLPVADVLQINLSYIASLYAICTQKGNKMVMCGLFTKYLSQLDLKYLQHPVMDGRRGVASGGQGQVLLTLTQ